MRIRWRLLGAMALVSAASPASRLEAQERADSLHSKILDEQRFLQVYLPAGYDSSAARKYDVVYVLDGEMLARFLPPIAAFEESNELMPPVIVVGIKNAFVPSVGQSSRERDLLPAHVEDSPLSGGADTFAKFLKDELIPFIARRYRTSGTNILFGHSYGGLFTVYLLLTQPTRSEPAQCARADCLRPPGVPAGGEGGLLHLPPRSG
ncbi:MAG: alpha/beta hydrolase-fold protein, partial [Gemmatimonadota bacterium]